MSLYQTFKKMQTGPVMIGVAIFALLTFTITGAVIATFAPDRTGPSEMHVTLPSGAKKKFTPEDRALAGLALEVFFPPTQQGRGGLWAIAQSGQVRNLQQKLFEFFFVGFGAAGDHKSKNNEVLQAMLLTALARDQGIAIAKEELSDWVTEAFETADQYRAVCRHLSLPIPTFEAALREALLLKRVMSILQAQVPVPSGDEIVARWAEKNERFTFEVASLPIADARAKLDPEKVTNDDLQSWFSARDEFENSKFRRPETFVLEGLAVFDPSAAQAEAFEALVAAATVQDSDARTYFDLAKAVRFRKSADPGADPAVTLPESAPVYFEFDEVKDRAIRETRVARALEKVASEVREALSQPGFDLKTIGEKYGLAHWTSGDPKVYADVATIPVHGCPGIQIPLTDAKEGELLPTYQAAPGAIQITRLVKKNPSRIPEVEEIRSEILADYLDEKAQAAAKEEMLKLADALKDATGDDRLVRLASERGLACETLAPIARSRREDPDFADAPRDVSRFLAEQRGFGAQRPGAPVDPFALAVGDVGGPLVDASSEKKAVYVVRVKERVKPGLPDMTAVDWSQARDAIVSELRREKLQEMVSSEALSASLHLTYPETPKDGAQ